MIRSPKTPLLASLLKTMYKAFDKAENSCTTQELEKHNEERRKFIKASLKASAIVGVVSLTEGCAKALE